MNKKDAKDPQIKKQWWIDRRSKTLKKKMANGEISDDSKLIGFFDDYEEAQEKEDEFDDPDHYKKIIKILKEIKDECYGLATVFLFTELEPSI